MRRKIIKIAKTVGIVFASMFIASHFSGNIIENVIKSENAFANTYTGKDAETYVVGESTYYFKTSEEGEISIVGYEGEESYIKIPSKINGKSVTSIGKYAFMGDYKIENVDIPKTVKTIGESAFRECSGLKSIAITHGVERVESGAFSRCYSLKSVVISDTVTDLSSGAFIESSGITRIAVNKDNPIYDSRENCNGIIRTSDNTLVLGCTKTKIPISVKTIGSGAFEYCGFENYVIPDHITNIERYAFYGCDCLESITVPDSVTSIGDYAFLTERYAGIGGTTIYVNEGSYAEKYVKDNKLKYVVNKTEPEPETESKPKPIITQSEVRVEYYGMRYPEENGVFSSSNGIVYGKVGQKNQFEIIKIAIKSDKDVGVSYTTHVQSYGWRDWSRDAQISGASGEGKRIEAFKVKLRGKDADQYDIYYRVHVQTYGWLNWAKNGEAAGTSGYGKRIEAFQIVVMKKGEPAPGVEYKGISAMQTKNGVSFYQKSAFISADGKKDVDVPGVDDVNVTYRTHVQSYGWCPFVSNGKLSGTTGKSKRVEAIRIFLANNYYGGGLTYRTHVQKIGWQDWKTEGLMSGTQGEAKRLEAIEIKLTGEIAEKYDIYYRVHAQHYGWLGWAKNGESAGTAGFGYRLEGIQIVLVKKGGKAPAANYGGINQNLTKKYISKY